MSSTFGNAEGPRRQAQAEHRLERRMRVYLAPTVLTIDEFGLESQVVV